MVFLNKGAIDIYKQENIYGVPVYVVENNYIRIQLESNRVDNNMLRKIGIYDYKHLETVAELVNNKDILERVYSKGCNESDLYIFILEKALKDKELLRWWRSYGFKVNIYRLTKWKRLRVKKERKRGDKICL